MTPEQREELKQLVAQQPPTGGITPEQRTELDALTKGDYSAGEIAGELGTSAEIGGRKGLEFGLDVLSLPIAGMERHQRGLEKWRESESVLGGIGGYLGEALNLTGSTATGAATHAAAFPKGMPQYDIPEGAGPEWLDPAKKGVELATEFGSTAFMGPSKWIKPALKAAIPAAMGGVAGEEYIGGAGGELVGILGGSMASDPKSLWELGKMLVSAPGKGVRFVKSGIENLRNVEKSLDDMSDKELRAGLTEMYRNAWPDGGPVDLDTYLDNTIPKLREQVKAGVKGTTGQLLDDPGTLQMEREFAKENRLSDIDNINAQLSEGAITPISDIAPAGVTERAGDVPRALTQLAGEEALAAERVAKRPFTQQPSTPEASTALHTTVSAIKETEYVKVKDAWAKVAGGEPIQPSGVHDEMSEFFTELSASKKKRIKKDFSATFEAIEDLEGDVSLDDISDIISLLSSEANQISKGVKPGSSLQHVDDIKAALYASLEQVAGGASKDRVAAAALYKQHMEKFGKRSVVGKALDKPTQEFAASTITGGDKGVSKRAELLRVTEGAVEGQADDFLRAEFKAKHIDPETGLVKAGGVNAFKKKYGDQISTELMAELDTAQGAARSLEKVGDKTLTTELGATDDIIDTAKRAMQASPGKNRVDDLKKLLDDLKAAPEAIADVRRAFAEQFQNSVTKKGKLTQDGLNKFKKDRKIYEESGLFTKTELDNIEKGMVEGQKMFLHADSAKLASLPPVKRRVAEIVAAIAGAKVGAATFGSPLIGAAIGRRTAVTALESMTTKQAQKIAYELSVNPQKFIDIVDKLKVSNISDVERSKALTELFKRAAPTFGRAAAIDVTQE